MNKDSVIIGIVLLLSLILQATVLTLPLVLYTLLCMYVLRPTALTVTIALIVGIILDAILLRPLGASSLFYLVSFFLMLQYERRFETATLSFVLLAATVLGFIHLLLFGSFAILIQTFLGTIFAGLVYLIFTKTLEPIHKEKSYPVHLLSKRKG